MNHLKANGNRLFLFVLFTTMMAAACSKSDLDPVYSECLVTKIWTPGDTSQTSTNFIYDANGDFVFWDGPGPLDLTVTYSANKIKLGTVAPYEGNYTVYYLGADSLAYASAQYNNYQRLDSTLYFYDNAKYLVKSVRYTDAFGKDSVSMTYTDGNLTRIVIFNANGTKPEANIQYNSTPAKSWFYQNLAPYNNNGSYFPWLGKSSKNLISSYSTDFNGNAAPSTLTYNLNSNGYVTDFTTTYLGSSYKTYFEYRCR